jgi:hypothetical protein
VFTSEEEINDLNDVSPNEMWIADFDELGPSLDYSDLCVPKTKSEHIIDDEVRPGWRANL